MKNILHIVSSCSEFLFLEKGLRYSYLVDASAAERPAKCLLFRGFMTARLPCKKRKRNPQSRLPWRGLNYDHVSIAPPPALSTTSTRHHPSTLSDDLSILVSSFRTELASWATYQPH